MADKRITPPDSEDEVKARHAQNARLWDWLAGKGYWGEEELNRALQRLNEGGDFLTVTEKTVIGPVLKQAPTLIHLQCADGRETLGLLNAGASQVVGVDISSKMLELAQSFTDALVVSKKLDASCCQWVCADLMTGVPEIGQAADLIYTGKGSLNWLHNLNVWARSCYAMLKPGGQLFVYDSHPVKWLFSRNDNHLVYNEELGGYFDLAVGSDQFPANLTGGELFPRPDSGYAGYRQVHTIGTILQAVIAAEFHIEHFDEHAEDYWESYLANEAGIPKTFSLLAVRPEKQDRNFNAVSQWKA